MKLFFRSLLHAAYAGAITQIVQTIGSPTTPKAALLSLVTGAVAGIVHFLAAK